jgi:hypothetical protein
MNKYVHSFTVHMNALLIVFFFILSVALSFAGDIDKPVAKLQNSVAPLTVFLDAKAHTTLDRASASIFSCVDRARQRYGQV